MTAIPEKVQRMSMRVEIGLTKALSLGKGKFSEFTVNELHGLKKCMESIRTGNEQRAKTQFVFSKKLTSKLPKAVVEFLK